MLYTFRRRVRLIKVVAIYHANRNASPILVGSLKKRLTKRKEEKKSKTRLAFSYSSKAKFCEINFNMLFLFKNCQEFDSIISGKN